MMPEQEAMLEKASTKLGAAKLLAEQGYFDDAASRAYYAMFHVAQAFLLGEGLSFSKHAAVVSQFGQRFAHSGRVPVELHRHLIDAMDRRNVADYQVGSGHSQETAGEQIAWAEEFLEMARKKLGAF
jgi:uncharacterized protein (UPF0332 family)